MKRVFFLLVLSIFSLVFAKEPSMKFFSVANQMTKPLISENENLDSTLIIRVLDPEKLSPIDSFVEHKILVKNTSSEPKNLIVTRSEIFVPEGWHVSMCLDLCLPDFVKTERWMIPANSEKVMSIDIKAYSIDKAELRLEFKDEEDRLLNFLDLSVLSSKSIVATLDLNSSAFIKYQKSSHGIELSFPSLSFFTLSVMDAKGVEIRQILRKPESVTKKYFFDVGDLAVGHYFVKVYQNKKSHTFSLIQKY
jgi:hypothetical protein